MSSSCPTPGAPKIVLLVSRCFGGHLEQRSKQDLAKLILDRASSGIGLEVEEVDGSLPENRDLRTKLFVLSGERGKYPQVFVRAASDNSNDNEQYAFFGLFDEIETQNDCGTLEPALLRAVAGQRRCNNERQKQSNFSERTRGASNSITEGITNTVNIPVRTDGIVASATLVSDDEQQGNVAVAKETVVKLLSPAKSNDAAGSKGGSSKKARPRRTKKAKKGQEKKGKACTLSQRDRPAAIVPSVSCGHGNRGGDERKQTISSCDSKRKVGKEKRKGKKENKEGKTKEKKEMEMERRKRRKENVGKEEKGKEKRGKKKEKKKGGAVSIAK